MIATRDSGMSHLYSTVSEQLISFDVQTNLPLFILAFNMAALAPNVEEAANIASEFIYSE